MQTYEERTRVCLKMSIWFHEAHFQFAFRWKYSFQRSIYIRAFRRAREWIIRAEKKISASFTFRISNNFIDHLPSTKSEAFPFERKK